MPVVECFAASRPQEGRSTNEDAFLLAQQAAPPWAGASSSRGKHLAADTG